MFYFKLFLVGLWIPIGTLLGLVYALFNQKNPNRFAIGLKLLSDPILRILRIRVVKEREEIVRSAQPCVYVGNHQSALDVVTYAQIMPPNCTAVAKSEVKHFPFLGWWYWAVGGSFIERKNRDEAIAQLKKLAERMNREKLSVAMMPEGTRNKKGRGLLPFKKGPFHLAILGQVPIVPVLSSPLEKIANYENRLLPGGVVVVQVLDPISTRGMTETDVDRLIVTVREKMEAGLADLTARADRGEL